MVAHSYPPYVGGLSYVVSNLGRELARRGHEVEVVTLDIGDDLPPVERDDGVLVRRFRGYAPAGGYFIPGKGFVDYLRQARADVYHLHNIGALTVPAAWRVLRKRGLDYVLTPHYHRSGYSWHASLLWRPYRLVARRIIRGARVVHSVSPYEASLLREHYGVDPVIVPNGVLDDVFGYTWRPPRDQYVAVYAGRLEHYKRVDRVIEALAELRDVTGWEVVARVIGRGPALEKIRRLAARLGVRLEHYEFLPREEYLDMLSTSTVLVNLSRYEAYSIVTAEALAIGLPVVITRAWGTTFAGIRGVLLVDPEDTNEVVEALAKAPGLGGKRELGDIVIPWRRVAELMEKRVYSELAREK